MATEVPNIDHVLDRLGELPAMPSKVAEVLRVTDDPVATMDDLNAVIERDPALTAKILKVSNSPYYGMRQFVGTLKLALVILGVREVRNIILGVAVLDTFGSDASMRLLEPDYWKHSNTVGAMSRCLVTRLRVNALGEAFVAGLLHDIGKVVMARQLPEVYEKVMQKASEDPGVLSGVEREMAGFGHAEAGAALGVKWNFPATLTDAILTHHPGAMPHKR
jgi:putative nucleotidyltransferase with HDIG domain